MKHNHQTPNISLPSGKVYLVGAGPGDPGLLTLRGLHCLQKADLVIADRLVHPRILHYANPNAQIIHFEDKAHPVATPAGAPRCLSWTPKQILSTMIEEAKKGRIIVRLKGGSPELFARHAEEIATLRQAGIPYEIVPGITAGLAASAYAEIPLTDSQFCSAVALLTGHERSQKQGLPLDYEMFGQFPGTLIVYMGVATSAEWSQALLRGGMAPETPVAIVQRCSWPNQQTIRCQLANLPQTIASHHIQPPAVILVGEMVNRTPERSWFEAKPLFGQRILLTRPEEQSYQWIDPLAELGADVLIQPAIQIADPPSWQPVDEALAQLDRYDWLVFSSANGVRYFLDRLWQRGADLRQLGRVKLAAIGPGTSSALAQYHLRADLVPQQFQAEVLAQALISSLGPHPTEKRVLWVRTTRGREVLADQLQAAGVRVEQIVAYSSTDVQQPDPSILQALNAGEIHWVTVTSSSIARSVVRMFGPSLQKTQLASISPITSAVLHQLGYPPSVEAQEYTLPGLVKAILQAVRQKSSSPSSSA